MSSTGASGVVRLRVICGPTAAGKSALAMRLAEALAGSIISADSRQVYRGFDIGTAKASKEEQRRVPHFGIDVVEPTERYSAAAWASSVPEWLTRIEAEARTPVVVGGTGFYLRALFQPLFAEPEESATRRRDVRRVLGTLSTAELEHWCRALDPSRSHLGRTQLLRAVETAILTGRRISELQAAHARAPAYAPRYLVIESGAALADLIRVRVERMLHAGWFGEVSALTRHVPSDAPAWTATGYEALREVVQNRRTIDSAREVVIMRTRQYAKRQRTWFRHQLPPDATLRLDASAPDLFERATAWWHEER